MSKFRVAIEALEADGKSTMRWEQTSAEPLGPFMLLGRAFELAQRDTDANF